MASLNSCGRSLRLHPPAIVLGLDSAINLSIVRELGEKGVPVVGVGRALTSMVAASRYCTQAIVRPEGPIASWLPDIVGRTDAHGLFAVSEPDLVELANIPETIGQCRILTPRKDPLDHVLSKARTLDTARSLGVDTPQTWQPMAGDDFSDRIERQGFPAIAKWNNPNDDAPNVERAGLKWNKSEYLRDADELDLLLRRFDAIGRWPLIQSYCQGVGVGQMMHMADGRATLRFQHVRLHEWPPEGGVSTLCRNESLDRHSDQMQMSERLLQALNWSGPAMVEYRYDAQRRRYWLMEVNGRFWGSLPLARHCNVHFAWEAYRRSVLGQANDVLPGTQQILRARYMIPETKRMVRILAGGARIDDRLVARRPLRQLLSYLADFIRPGTRYYVFSMDDVQPFLRDLRNMVGKILKRSSDERF